MNQRFLVLLMLGSLALTAGAGCQTSRQSVQIDRSPDYTATTSRATNPTTIQQTNGVGRSSEAIETSPAKRSAWSKLFDRFSVSDSTQPIPLPRTDLESELEPVMHEEVEQQALESF